MPNDSWVLHRLSWLCAMRLSLQQGTGERCRNICNACARCGTVAGGAFYFYRTDTFSFTIRLPAKYFATPLPDIVFVGLYLLTILLFPDVRIYSVDEYIANITNPVLLLRTVFAATYLTQIVIYVRLFRREQRNYMAKIENYFSDTDKYEFRWASRLFYEAACIGIAVLVFSIFPAPLFDGIITVVVTVYYFNFGVRYINYQYKLYYEALPAIEEKEESQPTKESEGDRELEDEMAKLLLYLQQGVVLGDYAEALHIPERKLSVFINSTYGVSFKRWVNNKRVEYATEQMAKHPDYTMERIAELSGFAHKSHFCKIFREITGGSFTEYKNR